ncbi:helix-turn-helix domain-containing protein [Nocardioides yefusunii]|uniref:Helix-turn-helix domain-containing protein n=1 Tax=Nocardioides yefusunii TaxID=2500546 RepID=A0ABW1QUI2_9ACTN|nr:helix-turn-helix transcriptional regulator [Nocardioides yefusunii]
MSTAEDFVPHPDPTQPEPIHPDVAPTAATDADLLTEARPDVVEVRRNGGVSGAIGAASSAVAIAWFGRAIATASVLDWVLVLITGALGVVWLAAFLDARTPLFVADTQGVRLRLGRNWIGLPWSAVAAVEHTERRGFFSDGRLEVVAHNPERLLAGLDPAAARQARLATRLHGGPLAMPLGLGTKVVHSDEVRVGADLAELAAAETSVVVRPQVVSVAEAPGAAGVADATADVTALDPVLDAAPAGDRVTAPAKVTWGEHFKGFLDRAAQARELRSAERAERAAERARLAEEQRIAAEEAAEEAAELERMRAERLAEEAAIEAARQPSPTPAPVREVPEAARADVLREGGVTPSVQATDERMLDLAPAEPLGVQPVVIDDFAVEPARDPVIGAELVAARTRLGMSVDQLAERTRIRPHVIEAIEVDDFAPCGGDFYARGHLQTLAKVLGADGAALLRTYDERYGHAPVAARKVFEAELAKGSHGAIRGARGGPNWSLLLAGVMGLVLVWSVVQVVTDSPAEVPDTPVLNGSGGVSGGVGEPEPVTVVVTAPESGAEIVVRDGVGTVVHSGSLAIGEKIEVKAKSPVRVQSTDGSVTVSVDGKERGAVGQPGDPAQGTYAGN